jgi:carboxyl-terminal processing protease
MVFLVGTSTFGKGSVQELIPVKNGCALKLTTMLYFLPDDESIQAKGIKPDFVIKPKTIPADEIKWIQELFGQETALKHHITVKEVDKVLGRETKEPDSKEKKKQEEQVEPEQESIELSPDSLSIEQEGTKSKQEDFGDKKDIKGKDKEKSWKEREKEELALDVQVQACVNMINLLYFAKINNSKIIDTREKTLSFLKSNYLTDEPAKIEKIK